MKAKLLACTALSLVAQVAHATTNAELNLFKWDDTKTSVINLSGYELDWADEFNTPNLSELGGSGTWIVGAPSLSYGPATIDRTLNPSVYSVSNGVLNITARPVIVNGQRTGKWLSGQVQTVQIAEILDGEGFAQQNGYFEARMKFPDVMGAWPAFWLKSQDHWRDRSEVRMEIDVLEWYGGDNKGMHHAVHLKPALSPKPGYDGPTQDWFKSDYVGMYTPSGQPINMAADWHTVGALLNETDIIMYVDRQEIGRFPRLEEFKNPLYPVLSLAVYDEAKALNSPAMTLQVDYVRVWGLAGSPNSPPAQNPPPVVQNPPPSSPGAPSLTASSQTVTQGQPLTLTWNAPGASSCTGIGTNQAGPTSGSYQFTPTASNTYQLTCTGPSGTTAKTLSINVVPSSTSGPSLAASDTTITPGQPVTLSWNAPGASSCTGIGTNQPGPTSGSFQVAPTASNVYHVSCNGPQGVTGKTLTITVSPQSASMVSGVSASGTTDPTFLMAQAPPEVSAPPAVEAPPALRSTINEVAGASAPVETLTEAPPEAPIPIDTNNRGNRAALAGSMSRSWWTNSLGWHNFVTEVAALPGDVQGQVLDQLSGAALSGGAVVSTMLNFKMNDLVTTHAFRHAAGGNEISNIVPVQLAVSQLSGNSFVPQAHRLDTPDMESLTKMADEGGAWVEPINLSGNLRSGDSSGNLDYTVTGYLTGHDWRLSNNWTAGVATGWSEFTSNNYELDTNAGGKSYNLALYAGYQRKNFFALNSASISTTRLNSTRSIHAIGEGARSDATVRNFALSSVAGYNFDLDANTKLTTAVTGLFTVRNQGAFSENGAGEASLNVEEKNSSLFVGGVSTMVTRKINFGGKTVTPELGVGMAFAAGDRFGKTRASFAGAPDAPFEVKGAEIPELVGTVHAGVNASLNKNTKMYVSYDGAGDSKRFDNYVSAGLRFRF